MQLMKILDALRTALQVLRKVSDDEVMPDNPVYHKLCSAIEIMEGPTSVAARDVLDERQRQVTVEGWTPEHDDAYGDAELAAAAATYAVCTRPDQLKLCDAIAWPWSYGWWKPGTYRRNLVKAAALLIAEIERLDRAEAKKEGA